MSSVPSWFFLPLLGLLGLVFGSFANVVIWRFPRGESLSDPPSHCPKCGHPVRWYDNVPVVSWLVLRGACRDCGEPIAARYPTVEALCAVSWIAAGVRFGPTLAAAFAIAFFYFLLVLTFIDIDLRRLPNVLVASLAGIGLAGVAVSSVAGVAAVPLLVAPLSGLWAVPAVAALMGAVAGAGLSLLIALIYQAVRGRPGMGLGDVKLLGAIGIFLGLYVLLAFFVATLTGAVVGIITTASAARKETVADEDPGTADVEGRELEPSSVSVETGDEDFEIRPLGSVPFGPFVALGAVVAVMWGPQLLFAYLHLSGLTGP